MAVDSAESTSLTISWSLADGATVTGYSTFYSSTDTQCFTDSRTVSGIAAGETSHLLTELEEATEYTVTVTALLTGGGSDEDNVTATTLAAGQTDNLRTGLTHIVLLVTLSHSFPSLTLSSSICSSHFCQYI